MFCFHFQTSEPIRRKCIVNLPKKIVEEEKNETERHIPIE